MNNQEKEAQLDPPSQVPSTPTDEGEASSDQTIMPRPSTTA